MTTVFFGGYIMRPNGLDFYREWMPNPNLEISTQEQYQHNQEHHEDFCTTKHIPSAIKLFVG
ncbi:MAG: hypothetical protein JKY53_00235 [Flavobacteriales bacterium]|nr:hypothetical protein [Flavobacteriales bacterium]